MGFGSRVSESDYVDFIESTLEDIDWRVGNVGYRVVPLSQLNATSIRGAVWSALKEASKSMLWRGPSPVVGDIAVAPNVDSNGRVQISFSTELAR